MADTIVRAELPQIDNCPILTRFKAFVVDQGTTPTLEHVFRDRVSGNPQDLSEWLASATSQSSSSSSSSSPPAGVVKLRVKEWLGTGPSAVRNPIWDVWGDGVDPQNGVVRCELTADITARSGIYELNWAVVNDSGRAVVIDRGIMSVERSLFAPSLLDLYNNLGPPTLQEVRMLLMDSSRNENILLDDIEFKDEQILQAIYLPVQTWNETPPPIRQFTTRDFPFRGAWAVGIRAQLHMIAANHYRRNLLKHSAGGVAIADKAKEAEYLGEGQRLWEEYKTWLANKKVEINLQLFAGQSISAYSARSGW